MIEIFRRWRERRSLLSDLVGLVRLEMAVVEAYDEAIRQVGLPGPADQLAQFRNEHAKHILDLLDGIVPLARKLGPRIRETLRPSHGFQGLRASDGTERALQELRAREVQTSRSWKALPIDRLPESWRALPQRFREDESRHLRFLEQMLASRVWAQGEELDAME